MEKLLKKTTVFTLCTVMFGLFLVVGCKKDNPVTTGGGEEERDFCSYVNEAEIHETTEMVNEFLSNLSNDLSNEEKLQELVTWFNSMPCIFDATRSLNGVGCPLDIAFSFHENETVKDYLLLMDKKDDTLKSIGYERQYAARMVVVSLKEGSINQNFDFINLFDHEVEEIFWINFISEMLPDSMQYIVDLLKTKPYICKSPGYCFAHGVLIEGEICISLNLFDIHNKEFQADWLTTMEDLMLIDPLESRILFFLVPEGKEKEWELKFKEYDCVLSVGLSHYHNWI